MPGQRTAAPTPRGKKVKAVLAGGSVLGLGVAVTLAAWTDNEWVHAGNGSDGPGLGTSSFEVEQNASSPFVPTGFLQNETNPGESLSFGLTALNLTPGDSVYAPVALRTVTDSIAGDLELQSAVPATGITVNDPDELLWDALTVRVAAATTATTCNAAAFTSGTLVASGPLGTAAGTATQPLAASGGTTQYYCFEITLPASPTLPAGTPVSALQGLSVAPAWDFSAESE